MEIQEQCTVQKLETVCLRSIVKSARTEEISEDHFQGKTPVGIPKKEKVEYNNKTSYRARRRTNKTNSQKSRRGLIGYNQIIKYVTVALKDF